jgi:hypothetical protein
MSDDIFTIDQAIECAERLELELSVGYCFDPDSGTIKEFVGPGHEEALQLTKYLKWLKQAYTVSGP